MPNAEPHAFDVIIIGSGAAGLTAALSLSPDLRIAVLAKGDISAGSTAWAQGGIAAVLDAGDTFEQHIEDTIGAGAGLNNRRAVESWWSTHRPRSSGWRPWACRSTRERPSAGT
jgi:L-aspartate oxidase